MYGCVIQQLAVYSVHCAIEEVNFVSLSSAQNEGIQMREKECALGEVVRGNYNRK